ncbi:putative dual-specificity RNA methyltransferase RlmN [Bienertia sinuspersici]
MTGNLFDNATLRFWHGGKFKVVNSGELVYVGGRCRTFQADPDQLCVWHILDLACKTGGYTEVDSVYYLIKGQSLHDGLRRVEKDASVLEMGQLAMKYRTIDLYVKHQQMTSNDNNNSQPQPLNPSTRPKLTPKRGPHVTVPMRSSPRFQKAIVQAQEVENPNVIPFFNKSKKERENAEKILVDDTSPSSNPKQTQTRSNSPLQQNQTPPNHPSFSQPNTEDTHEDSFLRDYDWVDPRPESPIRFNDLIDQSSEDEDDPLFEPDRSEDENSDTECELEDDFYVEEFEDYETQLENLAVDEGVVRESDNSDEEFVEARKRVKSCTSRLIDIAEQLQNEAAEGKLVTQQPTPIQASNVKVVIGYESDYYDSGDDLETPPGSGNENEGERRCRRGLLVGPETDFSTFTWKVGQRFTTRDDFKSAVAKYAIMQGRNVTVTVSNKARRQEVGVSCVSGCPFKLYGSWHSHKATFIVKKVVWEHHCHRNMKKNKQLKTSWVAKEMLDVFKARPHWPAKDIIETIKRAYKVLVTRTFAYKVKYCAHELLHGSMQEHYFKLGRYMAALKASSPGTIVELVTDGSTQGSHPVFQRLFTCFEGLQKGWRDGCRRIICLDAAFLKTFIGGHILAAVGRDANEQMFPIAWAAVEGENNLSWEWFMVHLQTCLQLGDGSGVAVISDEHPVSVLITVS